MIIDQPPQVIGDLTPAMKKEIGCAALWLQSGKQVEDVDQNIKLYKRYMIHCIQVSK